MNDTRRLIGYHWRRLVLFLNRHVAAVVYGLLLYIVWMWFR